MEQAVLGIFQEQLAKVIVGFRKEQVNANLLNGKGEIRDVSLNCSFLNEKIATVTPFIEFEEIHVSRLGFHVTSWTNLRKAPIIVDIGHITAKIQEPLQVIPGHRRRKLEMVTEAELIHRMLTEGFKPLRGSGSYGLVDRIVDNLTIEMDSFTLEYQTWGKFKTRRKGPWTPPALQVRFENLKVVMVDSDGNEASPDQVWEHNRNQRENFMIYKKMSGECQLRLCLSSNENGDDNNVNQQDSSNEAQEKKTTPSSSASIKLAETNMEVQMAIQRRLRDGVILAVQMDVTMPQVNSQVDSKGVHELAHFVAGLQYCFAKDRSFEDPLLSKSEGVNVNNISSSPSPVVRMMSRAETGDEDENDKEDELSNRDRADTADSAAETSSVGNTSGDCDGASVASWQSDEDASMSKDASSHGGQPKKGLFGSTPKQGSSRPVIILPNGLVVYKSILITCAVHDLLFRGFYPGATPVDEGEDEGYIEFIAKGCVTELIWPKVDRDPGLYAQLSTAFFTLQERFGGRKRTVMLGGMQRDDHLSLMLPSRKPLEIGADEFFPLFERRGIREDPLDLRHLFPTQALGIKTTVDIQKQKGSNDNDSLAPGEYETKYKVLHEMGLDEMDIVLDTDVFHRIVRFFLNEDGVGFDPRWHTGDWSELFTPEMLHHPNEILDLDECLQEPKLIFLDENSMVSSDLFNVTARLTNVEMKIPAAVQDNLRSCDIAMKWKETTLVVSSALPRTFLTGKICNSYTREGGEKSDKNNIDFPNDPSDICYALDKSDVGTMPLKTDVTSKSTFRSQVTVRGFETNIIPIIPFCKAPEPQQFLAISNSAIIFSFEGEPPKGDSNQIKITLFVSVLVHDLIVNLDLELLTGAIITILHHKDTIGVMTDMTRTLFPSSPTNATSSSKLQRFESGDSFGIKKNLKGRKVLVQRHISQSRETGGLAIVFCIQQHNFALRFWRQNIPLKSPIREVSDHPSGQAYFDDGGLVDVIVLLDYNMKEMEVGIEFDFHLNSGRRTVVKCCIDNASLNVCDVDKALAKQKDTSSIQLCSFGETALPGGIELHGNGQQIALRLEGRRMRDSQSWSLAGDITSPSRVHLHANAVKNVTLLILEVLLLPSWSKDVPSHDNSCPFPPGTIGEFFHDLLGGIGGRHSSFPLDLEKLDLEDSSDAIIERLLRAASKLLLPADLHVVLLRGEVANVLVSIPSNKEEATKSLSLLLHQADFVTRFYPVSGHSPSGIESILACKGADWSTLISTEKKGFYQRLNSKQSLLSFSEDVSVEVETVVHPFEASMTYSCATLDVTMSKGIRIDDTRQIEAFQSRLKTAILLSVKCVSDISFVINSLKSRDSEEKMEDDSPTTTNGDDVLATTESEITAVSNILKPRILLKKATEELLLYEEEIRIALRRRDDELEELKLRIFQKERERLGVVALMASRVAGWVRMGGMHRTGQRVSRKSMLWPYWTVLRKELLIIYPSPGVVKPFDIVSLINATIRLLAGGKSRQDIKRGFAVIESSGMTRYFVARNAQEFSLWTKEITETIKACSDPQFVKEMDNSFLNASEFDVFADDVDEDDESAVASSRRTGLGNRFASSLQSAKLKAKEFSERRVRALSNDSIENFDGEEGQHADNRVVSFDDGPQERDLDGESRRAALGKKISGVGQATKSRFGSAIQSARQKGAEISSRRRRNDNDSNQSLNSNGDTCDPMVDSLVGSDGQAPRRRLQLGNKLSSVIQSAKAGGLTGIRDKLGSTGQDRSGDILEISGINDLSGMDSSDRQLQSYWTCNACNFINSQEGCCEMCGIEQTPGNQELSPVEGTAPAAAVSLSDEQHSFSRSTSFEQNGNGRNSRFAFRRRQEQVIDDSVFGGDSLVLKNVYPSNQCPKVGESRPHGQSLVPLKRLQGNWTVAVNVSHAKDRKQTRQEKGISSEQGSSGSDIIIDNGSESLTMPTDKLSTRPVLDQLPIFDVDISRGTYSFGKPEVKKCLTFGEIAQLFTDISEAVEEALPQLIHKRCFEEAQKQEQRNTVEQVLIYGRILGGLLENDERNEVQKYQSEVIEGFFNSLLECPLPVEALLSLSQTLGICASTVDAPEDPVFASKHESSQVDERPIQQEERPTKIFSLLFACQSALQRFESEMAMETATKKSSRPSSQSNRFQISSDGHDSTPQLQARTRVCFDSILPPSLTNILHDSIHDALLNMMAERDQAHAQLIGANVMHIHSLERQRKKNEKLSAEVKVREEFAKIQADQNLNQPNLANLFGGKSDDRMAKMRQEIDLKMEAFHEVYRSHASTDEEITQLCTQLANEISTKTSYALEIERLKKVKETEVKEKKTLQDELKRMKELLAAEEMKRKEAEKQAERWKAKYESFTDKGDQQEHP
ncbi:chorein or VPS13 related protein [Nitzschia inconspicua]|uniref:Chorein or VPS13 related protein n=1 Tax=Nitzschia inconspicua TaxID=303405 RepID=A0A9K3KYP6_9STRA|nr:chorein or VPS13 related protein [Nitzschia inconspicua]